MSQIDSNVTVMEPTNSSDSPTEGNDADKYVESRPILSVNSTIPDDIVELSHSYGYDSKRYLNLCLIIPNVLVFASGNLIHFFTISERQIRTRRTVCGGGIGFITKNPNKKYNYLTIAENGRKPPIFIYDYPSMTIVSVCKNGTETAYSCIDYSPDGELMASQGTHPDYMITIWDWQNSIMILRTKSYQANIYNIMFSMYNEGQLATCGQGHIKFWKISNTYTGLKLKGDHGRFGKTTNCDIYGVCPMPGEQVLSGSEWGNILVWEDGLIKLEVCRKNRKNCHMGPITQFFFNDGEVTTVGMDGFVRVWFWETVDLADPDSGAGRFVEIEPIYEYMIGTTDQQCKLMSMIKMNEDSYWWYAQDAKGGIWICDINPDTKPRPCELLYRGHSGQIVGLDVCPCGEYFASLDEDGRLHIYNYKQNKLLFFKQFPARGQCLIWLPVSIDETGMVLIMGFEDGIIRMVYLDINGNNIELIQVLKPHQAAITKLSINSRQTMLVSGSEDRTIFLNKIDKDSKLFVTLIPIGFVEMPSIVTALNWKPNVFSTLIVGCNYGEILELNLPEKPQQYTQVSYKLENLNTKQFRFRSIKSEIRRNKQLQQIERKKAEKIEKKMKILAKLRLENAERKIDTDTFLIDSDGEEELEPLYIPEIPNRILWVKYTPNNTSLWCSVADYDAGYLYEFEFGTEKPLKYIEIGQSNDAVGIYSYLYFDKYLILGMGNGLVRIISIKEDFRDLSDYWQLSMHDNSNGIIQCMQTSFDKKYLFTGGNDSNIFKYKINLKIQQEYVQDPIPYSGDFDFAVDIQDNALSLEEQKIKNNFDQRNAIATKNKNKVLSTLRAYKNDFQKITERNQKLIKSLQIKPAELELDPRISSCIRDDLDEKMRLVYRRVEFDVEKIRLLMKKVKDFFIEPLENLPIEIFGIRSDELSVKTFRIQKLSIEVNRFKDNFDAKKTKPPPKRISSSISNPFVSILQPAVDSEKLKASENSVAKTLPAAIDDKLEPQMKRIIKQFNLRKSLELQQKQEWDYLKSVVPDPNKNDPEDVKALKEAKLTIGDYKLKTDLNYRPESINQLNTLKKFEELLTIRHEVNSLRNAFNSKIFKLRERKWHLVKSIENQMEIVNAINQEFSSLAEGQSATDFVVPRIVYDLEYPERNLSENFNEKQLKITCESIEDENQYNFVCKDRRDVLKICHNINEDHTDNLSDWEKEMIQIRLVEQTFLKNQIKNEILEKNRQFDDEIDCLKDERLQIEVDAKFFDIFMITLNQELWILKDFESLENELTAKVLKSTNERNKMKTKIMMEKSKIEDSRQNVEKLAEQEKQIQRQFSSTCMNNTFANFLKRIFKKKAKFQKEIKSEASLVSESESSSSDDDDNDDAASKETADYFVAFLDENVCPDGCDRKLYDLTLRLRSERHAIEMTMLNEKNKIIESTNLTSSLTDKIKTVSDSLDVQNEELLVFQREKQRRLNDIECLIILKLDQMQYFRNAEEFSDIDNTLLFNKAEIAKLYTRVGQISLETLEANRRHRINVVHLARMKTDCKYMKKVISKLDEDAVEAMVKKFGMMIDLNDLEESIIKRNSNAVQANIRDVQNEYEQKAIDLKKVYATTQEELSKYIQEGIEKLNILTVLQEEQNILETILENQIKLKKSINSQPAQTDYKQDLKKLREISNQQQDQIANLEKEIRKLRLKAKPFSSLNEPTQFQLTRNVPHQLSDDQRREVYEDSVYTSGSTRSSSQQANLSPGIQLTTINKLVDTFMFEHFSQKMEIFELKEQSYKISRYLAQVSDNFDFEQSDDLMACVCGNFKQFIPKKLHSHIPSDEQIAQLFETILKITQETQEDDEVVDESELLAGIVEDVMDTIKTTQITIPIQEYSNHIICEILKKLLEIFGIDELMDKGRTDEIVQLLSEIDGIHGKTIKTTKLLTSLTDFVAENFIDDVQVDCLKIFVDSIVQNLIKKIT